MSIIDDGTLCSEINSPIQGSNHESNNKNRELWVKNFNQLKVSETQFFTLSYKKSKNTDAIVMQIFNLQYSD